MANIIRRLVEEGQTYVEYGIVISLIAIVLLTTIIAAFGQEIQGYYRNISALLGDILGLVGWRL